MNGAEGVLAGATAFVATHFLLSHPLRQPLVKLVGDTAFSALYSAVALVTLGATIWAYRAAPVTSPLWGVGDGLWAVATAVMLLASILLMGSFIRNPALPGAAALAATAQARGVFAITRHPMMWSFAMWGASHILIYPIAKNLILSGAILLLALVGAALQDRKKAALDPDGWPAWERRTSYLPFVAILQRRATLSGLGAHALLGGILIWLAASWAHIPLAGWPAGIWRWLS